MAEREILERIKKLMALSQSSNPNEAAVALSRAQKLMAEHQISSQDLSVSDFDESSVDTLKGLADMKIMGILSSMVARAFGLEVFISGDGSRITSATFIGPKDRLQSGCYVYTIISRQATIVKKQFMAENRAKAQDMVDADILKALKKNPLLAFSLNEAYIKRKVSTILRKLTATYLIGWARAVNDKVQTFALDEKEEKLIDNFMRERHPDLRTIHRRRKYYTQEEMAAYNQGMSDGADGFELFRGVAGEGSKRLGYA